MQKIAFISLLLLSQLNRNDCSSTSNKFPDGFLFGVASSAYQIEGGHDANGKGESIWDHQLRLNPDLVADGTNGNVACDSYHQYEEDLGLLGDLGVDFYRFSISWTRILPTGRSNKINQDGIRYYNAIIDGLVARNIQPMVTMFHWDLPKALQDMGGWTNPLLVDYFEDYAKILFENFADRVKFWITFNANWLGHDVSNFPPCLNQSGSGEYLYAKHVILAHARAYHLYHKLKYHGKVGFTIDGRCYEAATHSQKDQDAAERIRQFYIGTLANPIFGSGDFPEIVKNRVGHLSRVEGYSRSRLPEFSDSEIEYVKGSFDFLGLNIYTAFLISDISISDDAAPSFVKDIKARLSQDSRWPQAKSDWLRVAPWSVRNVLKWVKENYGNPPVFITENGFSDDGRLEDLDRIQYYKLYLKSLLEAIHEDKVRVLGYAAWSLLDNFEWTLGFSEKFGLHHVDFDHPNRKRTPKESAKWYKNLIKRRELNETTSSYAFKNEL